MYMKTFDGHGPIFPIRKVATNIEDKIDRKEEVNLLGLMSPNKVRSAGQRLSDAISRHGSITTCKHANFFWLPRLVNTK